MAVKVAETLRLAVLSPVVKQAAAVAAGLILLGGLAPASAQLNGQLAIRIWGSSDRLGSPSSRLAECQARLVPEQDPNSELGFACGELFTPPPGKYVYWVETEGRISPEHLVLIYSGGTYSGKTMEPIRGTVPAGRVGFEGQPFPHATLRLLQLDSHYFDQQINFQFHRRIASTAGAAGAQLPAGQAVALLYDDEKKEYLALGRPFSVPARRAIKVPAPTQTKTTSVLAVLERPELISTRADDDLAPRLAVNGQRLPPDLIFGDAARVYALWYEVEGKEARLELDSQRWRIEPESSPLRPRKVEVFRPRLLAKPRLKVSWVLPQAWASSEAEISLTHPGNSRLQALASQHPAEGAAEVTFFSAPAEKLEVELKVGSFSRRQAVDLSDGLDHDVFFDAELIEISGQVLAGDKPSPATLFFYLNPLQNLPEARDEFLEVRTNEEGRYSATFFTPGYYPTSIQLAGHTGLAFLVSSHLWIGESGNIDFKLPANRFDLVVTNQDGEPVPSAKVLVENHFGEDGDSVTSTRTVTGKDGRVKLPPIRPGRLELAIHAAGYQDAAPRFEVAERDPGRTLKVVLSKLETGESLALLLPSGRPAAGAAAALFTSTTDGSLPWWEGRANADGILELPPRLDGSMLLIRHPAAGCLVMPASQTGSGHSLALLERAADIQVKVVDHGGNPAPASGIGLKLQGANVAGMALAWLLSSPLTSADGNGFFRASGLPQQPVGILAWAPGALGPDLFPQLAQLATAFDLRAGAQLPAELVRIE